MKVTPPTPEAVSAAAERVREYLIADPNGRLRRLFDLDTILSALAAERAGRERAEAAREDAELSRADVRDERDAALSELAALREAVGALFAADGTYYTYDARACIDGRAKVKALLSVPHPAVAELEARIRADERERCVGALTKRAQRERSFLPAEAIADGRTDTYTSAVLDDVAATIGAGLPPVSGVSQAEVGLLRSRAENAERSALALTLRLEEIREGLRKTALEATTHEERMTAVEMLAELLEGDCERDTHEHRVRSELGTAEAMEAKAEAALVEARSRFERAVLRKGGA